MFKRNESGQGALEYLLLIVAAMFVVAAVIFFMSTAGDTAQSTGTIQLYNNLCVVLDSNTPDCACYNSNAKGYFPSAAEAETYCCVTNTVSYLKTQWGCQP
jgi:uncharacterized protein (UPF0333 family)